MGHWQDIAKTARSHHAAALMQSEGETSAAALLTAAEQLSGIERLLVPAGDPLLYGGDATLDVENGIIWYNQDIEFQLAAFYQAHEYAHFWLDGSHATCTGVDINAEDSEEPVPLGVRRVEGYGPEERREREANVFAREFLLPTDVLKDWYLAEGLDATAIAARVGVPEGMVLHQLTRALLTPDIPDEPAVEVTTEATPNLDPSQQAAAHAEHGPLLLEAGPGAGKTRTLIGRIHFLVGRDVLPSSILALAFSNKAAEEMRSRVAKASPDAAPRIWMGTFHAIGLELLRKFGTHLGLPPKPDVTDPVEALFLLERSLPELRLDHYQNLYEPTTYLRNMLAERQLAMATNEKEVEPAEKALEVARVYAFYQGYLEEEGLLDFGDLIYRSVHLLQAHADVRSWVRQTYAHVLVDEYQDVNRASGVLLREITGTGEGLWVVGDVRQAIYRFRGAAPRNMRLFTEDFPGAEVKVLERNYRSQPAVLETFSELAPRMSAAQGASFAPWQPERPDSGGKVAMEIAEDAPDEKDGHDEEEEECFFFVGLSLAKDTLCLSRARRYGKRNSNPSTLLSAIASRLSNPPDGKVTWEGGGSASDAITGGATPSSPPRVFTVRQLDVYIKCPRKYYYEFVLGLGGRREESAYVQFHRCVYKMLLWLQDERAHGRVVDEKAAQRRLAEIWESAGPMDHPYENIYRRNAEAMVDRAVEHTASMSVGTEGAEWEVALPHGRVRFTPDHVELLEGDPGPVPLIQRLRTGRPSKGEQDDPIYALYQKGAEQAFPRSETRVERLYLSTGQVEDARLKAKSVQTRLNKYDDAIAGIQRGEFPAKPDDHVCPRCPHYFVCPAAEDA